ncbi:MAG: helix-turn-helix domain-containing protein [Solirubrobacterales bacterium]
MTRDDGRNEYRAKARIKYIPLPRSCAEMLAEHPNARIQEALGNPVRRGVLRALHQHEPPCSAGDVSVADSLKSESISTIKYHLKVLQECGVAAQSGELVTTSGYQPLYVSRVADDDLVLSVLGEMRAEDDEAESPRLR